MQQGVVAEYSLHLLLHLGFICHFVVMITQKANHVVSYASPLQSNFSGGEECSEMPSQHATLELISSLVSRSDPEILIADWIFDSTLLYIR